MLDQSTNNKRLAKNTIVLYLRMLFTMVLQLYTSRLVLQALGVEDYGIYNVVGGVIAMLNFVNMSLSNANSRFIAVEIGSGNQDSINKVFSCIMSIHWLFAILIIVFAETVGLWFVMTKLTIPEGRMTAAIWVYQSAVLSSIITIISSPYNGLIIAHEKMSAFAVISIFDAVAKFCVAISLFYSPIDRLILYAILYVFIQLIVRLIYMIYCKKKFVESSYHITWDKKISTNVLSFAGWTLTGNISVMGYTQGLNILLNIFFGAVVNAARGISVQVQAAARMFFAGFQTAINPQIIKSYAQHDYERLHTLVFMSSRFSFFLMLLVTIPLCIHTQYILELWLGTVPEYTAEFVRIMLVVGLINTLQNPTMTALHATGNIKKVQIVESTLLLSVVPLAYLFLKFLHIAPVMVFVVYLVVEFITQFVRVYMIYPLIKLRMLDYFTKVMWPICIVSIASVIACLSISKIIVVSNFGILFIAVLAYVITTAIIVFLFGLKQSERVLVNSFICKKLLRK